MSSRQRSTAREIEEKQRKKKTIGSRLTRNRFVRHALLAGPTALEEEIGICHFLWPIKSTHTEWKLKPFSRWKNLVLEACLCQPAKVVVRINCKQLNRFCSTPTKTREEREAETKICLDARTLIILTIFLPQYYANEDVCIRLIYNWDENRHAYWIRSFSLLLVFFSFQFPRRTQCLDVKSIVNDTIKQQEKC